MRKRTLFIVTALFLTACTSVTVTDSVSPELSTDTIEAVREYTDAFNTRNLESMLSRVTDDIQWLSIEGDRITVVTNGKEALAEALESYFKQCASCQSRLENVSAYGNRVNATEIASWESNGQRRSQGSMSVYELSDGLIRRVYYFSDE